MFVPRLPTLVAAVRTWSVESQQVARRNAMVAATACAQRRVERQDVDDFLRARFAPPRERDDESGSTRRTADPGSRLARAQSADADLRSPVRDRVVDQPPRHPFRRRHPPARLDQRPRPADRRPHRRAVQRAGHQPLHVAGPAASRLRRPGRVVVPPRRRRLRPAPRPQPRRDRALRRGRPLGHGPLRHRHGGPDGLVDGRQHDVRAGRAAPRARLRPVRGLRRARRHLPHDARAAARAARGGPRDHRQPRPLPERRRVGPDADRHPAADRPARDRPDPPDRLHVPGARPRARRRRRSRSSSAPRSTGTSTSRSAPRGTPASG